MNLLFQIYIALYILFASVTLCRLGGPMVFITRARPPSPRDGGTAASRTNVVAVDISELPRPRDGIGPPRRGQAVEVAAVVAVCNPDGLAIGEAGSGGEAHRSWCRLLWNSTGSRVARSIPQPHQKLPAVDPLPFHVPIVGGEVREARMHGGRLQGDVPCHGVVGGVRAIPEDVGEGRAGGVHVQAVAEGGGHESVADESIVAGRGVTARWCSLR